MEKRSRAELHVICIVMTSQIKSLDNIFSGFKYMFKNMDYKMQPSHMDSIMGKLTEQKSFSSSGVHFSGKGQSSTKLQLQLPAQRDDKEGSL